MTFSFVKFGCSIGIFLNTAHLICRSTDISKCFRGSLRLRDNESRLYMGQDNTYLFYTTLYYAILSLLQPNFNGSNTIGTMKISSRRGSSSH